MSHESTPADKRRTPPGMGRKATLRLREPSFVPSFNKVTSASAVIFTEHREIVATVDKRGPDFPGGHVQEGEESAAVTVRRESREEAGAELRDVKFVLAIESDLYGTEPEDLTYMVIMTAIASDLSGIPTEGTRVILTREQFKNQHVALKRELMEHIVDAAYAVCFAE